MSISVERAERILKQGFGQVQTVVARIPAGPARKRAEHVQDAFGRATWAVMRNGGLYALRDQQMTPLLIALVPDSELGRLETAEPFQTEPHGDDAVLLKVRTVSLTPLWAGLVLFHELSHVHDLASRLEPRDHTPAQYWEGESRAYSFEMALVEAHTDGALGVALTKHAEEIKSMPTADLAGEAGSSLASRLERATFGAGTRPPASDNELGLRDAFFRCAALISAQLGVTSTHSMERPEAAASALEALGNLMRQDGS